MKACSLIVLCLINISLACNSKIDKNGNLYPYEYKGQNRIETEVAEANYLGGNDLFDTSQALPISVIENNIIPAEDNSETGLEEERNPSWEPHKHWDVEGQSITNWPNSVYTTTSSGIGRPSSFYGDIILPQGKLQFHPHNHVSAHTGLSSIYNLPNSGYNIVAEVNGQQTSYQNGKKYTPDGYYTAESIVHSYHNLPSSTYNIGAGDKERLPNYNKGKVYTSDGYYASESYVKGGLTGHNYHNLANSGFNNGAEDNGKLSSYNKGTVYTPNGYYVSESNIGEDLTDQNNLPNSGYNIDAGDNERISSYNKGKPYISDVGGDLTGYHYHYLPSSGYHINVNDNGRLPGYNKGKPYTPSGYYKSESSVREGNHAWGLERIGTNETPILDDVITDTSRLAQLGKEIKGKHTEGTGWHPISSGDGKYEEFWRLHNLNHGPSKSYTINSEDEGKLPSFYKENAISADDNSHSITGKDGNIKNIWGSIWQILNPSNGPSSNSGIRESKIQKSLGKYSSSTSVRNSWTPSGDGKNNEGELSNYEDLNSSINALCQSYQGNYNNQMGKGALRQIYDFGLG